MYVIRLIPILVFGFILYKAIKRKNKVSITIIGLYFLSSFSSLFINSENLRLHDFNSDSFFSFLIYTLILACFLSLTFLVKPYSNVKQLPNGKLYNLIQIIFILGSLYSLFYLSPYAIKSLLISALELRTDMQIYGLKVLPESIFTTIAVGFPSFYFVYCFMFFISIVKKQKLFILLNLVGPIAFIINVLTVSGRDGVILTFFAFILTFFLFENLINSNIKKRLKKVFILGFSIAFIPIFFITIDRFRKSEEFNFNTLNKGIISYIGVQPFVFADNIQDDNPIFNYGANSFPLFTTSEVVTNKKFYSGLFGTFLVAFYKVSGYSSLILISLIFYLLFFLILKLNNRYSVLSMVFFLSLFFHFIITGIFYFRLGTKGGNLYLVLSLLIFFILRNTRKNKNLNEKYANN